MQDLTFRGQDGKEAAGKGELTCSGRTRRAIFATSYAVVGLLLGLATFVPGPHMCVTWAFPFVGALLAMRAWLNEAELNCIEGACPACDAPGIKVRGGQLVGNKPLSRACQRCMATFDVVCERAEPDPAS